MPASSSPTSCSVYLSGHDAQITASSDNFNVAPFCRATIQAQAASGLVWNNYPPSPMPNIESIYITVSWAGNTPFNIPAKWSATDVNNTIQSEMNRFNSPSNVNAQVQGGLTP